LINAFNIGRYRKVLNHTIGIIFFATPHRGADLAMILGRIQKVTFSERKFVGDLEMGSKTVNRINNLFAEHSDKFEFVSFWESKSTRFIGVFSLFTSLICEYSL
jgi:hypothetical protein